MSPGCLFVYLYPINVKAAEPIGHNLCGKKGLWKVKNEKLFKKNVDIDKFLKIFLKSPRKKIVIMKIITHRKINYAFNVAGDTERGSWGSL